MLLTLIGQAAILSGCLTGSTTGPDNLPSADVENRHVDLLSKSSGPEPGVQKAFPLTGSVNTLIVFVQHRDDEFEQCLRMDGDVDANSGKSTFTSVKYEDFCAGRRSDGWDLGDYQSWTDDSLTEWPKELSASDKNLGALPVWARGLIYAPGSDTAGAGTLTDMYRRISNGRLNVRGAVWPYTYRPNRPHDWYKTNRAPYVNGMVRVSREVLEYVASHPCGVPGETECGISWDPEVWDRYTNGQGGQLDSDGVFDMIVLLFRFSSLRSLTGIRNATSITTFGSNSGSKEDLLDPTGANPLYFGDLRVIDNRYSGSGVIAETQTKRHTLRIIAHEIGHRQFGYYHTDDDGSGTRDRNDFYSLMSGSPHLGVSVADRVKAGWANIRYEDVNTFDTRSVTLENMWNTGPGNPDVLWLTAGSTPSCGDLVIEARKQTFFLDQPPAPGEADGDGADFFLPNEGLLIVKAAEGECAGSNREYSSMPNQMLYTAKDRRWKYFGTAGAYPAFGPGQAYTPQFVSSATYDFVKSTPLDSDVAITDIREVENGFSFTVHSNYEGTVAELEAVADAYVDKSAPSSNFGRSSSLRVVNSGVRQEESAGPNEVRHALLAWDLTAIPVGAIVHSVRLRIHVENETSPAGFSVFELNRGWSETQTTWLQASSGQPWTVEGASGSSDRGSTIISSFVPRNHGLYSVAFNADGVALVQKWIDDTSSNYGIMIAYGTQNANEVRFLSREWDDARSRPVLEVTYLATDD